MCVFIIVLNALGNLIFSPLLLSCFSSCILRSPMIICLLLSTFLFKIASVFIQKSVASFVYEGPYIYKKENPNNSLNYRFIALICTTYKIYSSLITKRLSDFMEEKNAFSNITRGF